MTISPLSASGARGLGARALAQAALALGHNSGDGKNSTNFPGMGPATARVQAPANNAVIFVEIAHDYRAIVQPFAEGLQYFGLRVNNQTITYRAAFIVRDPRELGDSDLTGPDNNRDFGLFQNTPARVRKNC